MKSFLKIPVITGTLLFALAQPTLAQSGSTDKGTRTGSGTNAGTNPGTNSGTNKGTSVGNNTDISGGTTNTGNKNEGLKTAKSSRHCASNEDFVKQGDHMVCVPKSTRDQGQSEDSKPNSNAPDLGNGVNR